MKKFISSINEEKYNPPLITDNIPRKVKFESRYLKPAKEYKVTYQNEGCMNELETILLINSPNKERKRK